MSSLKTHEKVVFEKLFDRGGYVLNFNDATYATFCPGSTHRQNQLAGFASGHSWVERNKEVRP